MVHWPLSLCCVTLSVCVVFASGECQSSHSQTGRPLLTLDTSLLAGQRAHLTHLQVTKIHRFGYDCKKIQFSFTFIAVSLNWYYYKLINCRFAIRTFGKQALALDIFYNKFGLMHYALERPIYVILACSSYWDYLLYKMVWKWMQANWPANRRVSADCPRRWKRAATRLHRPVSAGRYDAVCGEDGRRRQPPGGAQRPVAVAILRGASAGRERRRSRSC